MPSFDIDLYLSASDASVILTGTFRKKSRDLKLWKSRNFEIRSDGILLTYDPQKNIPTDIINITNVKIESGSRDNLDKSGSVDFSVTCGVSIVMQAVYNDNMEIVFDSQKEAEDFCYAVVKASRAIDMMAFAEDMQWEGVKTAIVESGKTTSALIVGLSKTCDAEVVHSGRFIKRSSLRDKQKWKFREFEIRAVGTLTYKNRIGVRDRNDVIGAFLTRVQVDIFVAEGNTATGTAPSSPTEVTAVGALEIVMPREGSRRLVIAFDEESPESNQKQIEEVIGVLSSRFGGVVVNSTPQERSYTHTINDDDPMDDCDGVEEVDRVEPQVADHGAHAVNETQGVIKESGKSSDYSNNAVFIAVLTVVVAVLLRIVLSSAAN